jgi:23S rRNA (cytidine1920-2'-O)/16S rRNA (cytidine1409-2'-O)-methyltransferase
MLVSRGLAPSKSAAKALVMSGKVRSGTQTLDKPGKDYPGDIPLSVVQPPKYVSRGGEKLEGILNHLNLDVSGATALDIGASTGGFTDCLLQRGVTQVVCIDVGRNQLHPKIQADPRVTNIEKYNARNLQAQDLPYPAYSLMVTDVSFISLKLILPPAWPLLEPQGIFICLVKPQFEASKTLMDQCKGVIPDFETSLQIAEEIRDFALDSLPNSRLLDFQPSVIQGTDGNQEFLMALQKKM